MQTEEGYCRYRVYYFKGLKNEDAGELLHLEFGEYRDESKDDA